MLTKQEVRNCKKLISSYISCMGVKILMMLWLLVFFFSNQGLNAQNQQFISSSSLDSIHLPGKFYTKNELMQQLILQSVANNHADFGKIAVPMDSVPSVDSIYVLTQLIDFVFPTTDTTLQLSQDSLFISNLIAHGVPELVVIEDSILTADAVFKSLMSAGKTVPLVTPVLFNHKKTFRDSVWLKQSTYTPLQLSVSLLEQQVVRESEMATVVKKQFLETLVKRKADSIRFDMKNRKVFLYHNAQVEYGTMKIDASYIELDFKKSQVFATGLPDSTGLFFGYPIFSQDGSVYEGEEMNFNFDTQKGVIHNVITQDGEGFLHGSTIKKMEDGSINAASGQFTTCNLKHPHYAFNFKKARVIPDKKMVTGPAYLSIADVPTPLFLPFGIFPHQSKRNSGIIIPGYGQSSNRGFFLEDGGYYWAISDLMDLELIGDIYTMGSWAVDSKLRYVKRYKYNGNLSLGYGRNVFGIKGTDSYSDNQDFKVRWRHAQDIKARPNSRFSADVNIYSRTYNDLNPTTTNAYLSNTFTSKVAYQKSFGEVLYLTVDASHSQNTREHTMSVKFPTVTLNSNQFNPFRKKNRVGKMQWYENINVKYSMQFDNRLEGVDSTIFNENVLDRLQYGMKHIIPVSSTVSLLKFFNWTNTINYNEYWYGNTIRQYYQDTITGDTVTQLGVITDTVQQFASARDFSYSSAISTKLYGMFGFKGDFFIQKIRHVLTPSIGFSYRPDFSDETWGYYDTYFNPQLNQEIKYSKFQNGIYGGPGAGRQQSVSMNLKNTLEMKVRSAEDTITGTKKIKLIEGFNLSMGYNFAADSLRWSDLSMSGFTSIFKGLSINYRSSWTPYVRTGSNQKINTTVWETEGKLFEKNSANYTVTFSYNLNSKSLGKKGDKKEANPNPQQPEQPEAFDDIPFRDYERYVDWSLPWSFRLGYSMSYTNLNIYEINQYVTDRRFVQTIDLNGSFNLTKNWKVIFRTGYDFEMNKVSYTVVDILRDLHCWEMGFNWVPFGSQKRWSFRINVKASMFKDLKYEKEKDFRDYY